MKKIIMAMMAAVALGAQAQEAKTPSWISNVKLSGYVISQYQYSGQKGNGSNTFNIRLARMAMDGRLMSDFYWKMQVQLNGNTSTLTLSPRIVDAFVEWQKVKWACVKVGQFKRPFTFENPMHPIDQGFMGYSQNVNALAGFADRDGQQASNGRDIGVQLQGDLLPNANGRALVHYQVGVFNGQGINQKDVDQQKDLIGGVWVMPVKGMRLGVFGWEGSYSRQGTWTTTAADGTKTQHSGIRKLPQHRYAISGEYVVDGWTFRSEYIHSTGLAFTKTYNTADDAKDANVNEALGNKADGWYGAVIAPVVKQKFNLKARYDLYRKTDDWAKAKTNVEVGADYFFNKGVKLSAEFIRVNDRALADHNYNAADVQVSFRF